ncbi:zinc metalloprotease [Psychroflexus aestuariivivens]|uniref:M43 family zinc metalloprotease n=1 Tax=Psychroflexus aestuariivivens TaxID=1795040 RepID=UPI000FDC4587|nr:M43 family zinc metalloprotease [Psychroflexus aestuariivivens]
MLDFFQNTALFAVLLFLNSSSSETENFEYCVYDDEVFQQNCHPDPNFTYSTDPEYLDSFPEIKIRVHLWGFNQDDGSSEDKLTEDKIHESLKLLNSAFKNMKVCFELDGFDLINDSELYWTNYYKFGNKIRSGDFTRDNALNIYIPYKFTNNNDKLRGGKMSNNRMTVNMLNYNTGILVHEVGHIFGLMHTHSGYTSQHCERVTRDENDPNYNAKCAGDRVTDTNAMPKLYGKFHKINENCEYIGDATDCEGTPYTLEKSDIQNFMAYTQHSCRAVFTTGQKIRAREYIANQKPLQEMIMK